MKSVLANIKMFEQRAQQEHEEAERLRLKRNRSGAIPRVLDRSQTWSENSSTAPAPTYAYDDLHLSAQYDARFEHREVVEEEDNAAYDEGSGYEEQGYEEQHYAQEAAEEGNYEEHVEESHDEQIQHEQVHQPGEQQYEQQQLDQQYEQQYEQQHGLHVEEQYYQQQVEPQYEQQVAEQQYEQHVEEQQYEQHVESEPVYHEGHHVDHAIAVEETFFEPEAQVKHHEEPVVAPVVVPVQAVGPPQKPLPQPKVRPEAPKRTHPPKPQIARMPKTTMARVNGPGSRDPVNNGPASKPPVNGPASKPPVNGPGSKPPAVPPARLGPPKPGAVAAPAPKTGPAGAPKGGPGVAPKGVQRGPQIASPFAPKAKMANAKMANAKMANAKFANTKMPNAKMPIRPKGPGAKVPMPTGGSAFFPKPSGASAPAMPGHVRRRSLESSPSLERTTQLLGLEAILGKKAPAGLGVPRSNTIGRGEEIAAEPDLTPGQTPKSKKARDARKSKRGLTNYFTTFRSEAKQDALAAYQAALLGDGEDSGASDAESEGPGRQQDVDVSGWANEDEESSWPSDWAKVDPHDINQIAGEIWGMLETARMDLDGFKVEWGRSNVDYAIMQDGAQQSKFEYTSRDTLYYSELMRSEDHEVAVTGGAGEKGDDHSVIVFDCPSKSRSAVRVMIVNKRGSYRAVVRGVTNRKDIFKKISAGEICPKCGLKGTKDFVPVKSRNAKTDAHGSAEICETLSKLEKSEIIKTFKWGVLNCRAGQTEENVMYSNLHENASSDYLQFLNFLGDTVELSGFTGYRGGLDNRGTNATGTHSVHTKIGGFEIMYHVATMLPFQPDDAQRVERKRHLGNDIVAIIFREADAPPFDPLILTTQFTNIFCVVSVAYRDEVTGEPYYQVVIANKTGMPPYGPYLADPPVYKRGDPAFRELLLTKLINGERCALWRAPDFKFKMQRTRQAMLGDMVSPFLK